jgi:hypothetical protein
MRRNHIYGEAYDSSLVFCRRNLRTIDHFRGNASVDVEFGAKVSVSVIGGTSYVGRISWDAYNESTELQKQVESFKARPGSYPESVHADKIYRTRDNLRWCQEKGIRLSGPPRRWRNPNERYCGGSNGLTREYG